MTKIEQEMYNFSINENYFSPTIDIEKSRKSASEKYGKSGKDQKVKYMQIRLLRNM